MSKKIIQNVLLNSFASVKSLLILLALIQLPVLNAFAARPMITDDARVVDSKSCQIETWIKVNKDSEEYWALPACNFFENLELTIGTAAEHADSETTTTDVLIQGKYLFKKLETNSWSWALAIGNVNHPDVDRKTNLLGDIYFYVPVSFSLRDDALFIHTNVGVLHDDIEKKEILTWGLGTELQLSERNWLIAEAFGQDRGNPFYQIGLRHWIIPNRMQFDATYGNRLDQGDDERWMSFGIRLLSDAFLP